MRNIFVLLSITILFAQNEVCFEIEDNILEWEKGNGDNRGNIKVATWLHHLKNHHFEMF